MNISKTGRCKVFCCVDGCSSKGTRNRQLSFHLFPKENKSKVRFKNKEDGTIQMMDLRRAWILTLKIVKPVSKFMKICSLHFRREDFSCWDLDRKRRVLKRHIVPSCNLPMSSFSKEQHIIKETNWEKVVSNTTSNNSVSKLLHNCDIVKPQDEYEACEDCSDFNVDMQSQELEGADICSLKTDFTVIRVNAIVQVDFQPRFQNYLSDITSDETLNSVTKLGSLALLNTLTELVKKELDIQERSCLKVDVKMAIVMTIVKLKTYITYPLLSLVFHSVGSPTTCRNICRECVVILACVLKTCRFDLIGP